MTRIGSRSRGWKLVGALVLAAAVFGVVSAVQAAVEAIPGPDGVIQGCYDKVGALRVVSALPCAKGQTPLAWNQTGPQGLKGDTGPTGRRDRRATPERPEQPGNKVPRVQPDHKELRANHQSKTSRGRARPGWGSQPPPSSRRVTSSPVFRPA